MILTIKLKEYKITISFFKRNAVNWMRCLELIKCDVSNTSYYVEVENGALLHDVALSWKMILGGHRKS